MQRALEIRSLVIGLLLGLLVAIGLGAAQAIPPGVRPDVDRFEIETGDSGSVYVLDTATGQVWGPGHPKVREPKLGNGN
jgi:hypothetical protein